MNEPVAFLAQPHMGFFASIIIGGLAGWFAGMFTGMKHGLFTNILIGIAGWYVASYLAGMLDIGVNGSFMRLIVATIGAIIIVYAWSALRGNQSQQ